MVVFFKANPTVPDRYFELLQMISFQHCGAEQLLQHI